MFDKIWCLTCLDQERLVNSQKEFQRLGWNIEYFYNPKNPITRWCPKYFFETDFYLDISQELGYKIFENVLSCFMGHYNIIKTSYMLGYNSVLIVEDDLQLLPNISIENLFNQVPKDFDIINFTADYNVEDYENEDNFFTKVTTPTDYRGCVMYAINRKFMKWYLDFYEKHLPEPADMFYKHIKELNFYVNNYNIVKQEKHKSDITDE